MPDSEGGKRKNAELAIRKCIANLAHDLKESLMIVANRNAAEYEVIKRYSIEDFLIKYEVFISELSYQHKAAEANAKKAKRK